MNRTFFHFHKLGYRRNPFGALTSEEWAAVAVLPGATVPLLLSPGGHWQILGPLGSGKTTSLLGLQAHFARHNRRAEYEYLPEGQDRFVCEPGELDYFLLDEAQRLRRRERRRLMEMVRKGAFHLIMSSHEDLGPLFERWKLPLSTVSLTAQVSPEHYQAVLAKRLGYFALPGVPQVTLGETAVHFLYETFGENLREAEYFLYEVWQRRETAVEISGEQLAVYHREF